MKPTGHIRSQRIRMLMLLLSLFFASAFAAGSPEQTFQELADEFFDDYLFPHNPSFATQQGIHKFDDRLKDYSKAGVNQNIQLLKQFERRVSAINPLVLNEQLQGDRDLILNYCRSELLTLEVIRPWEKNPGYYLGGMVRGAFVIMKRSFAPVNNRLKVFIEREKLMPAVLEAARLNLVNPPKVYTEVALEQLPGIINFFKNKVPEAFIDADDPELKQALEKSNANVITALREYQFWIKNTLLAQSQGDFRLGSDVFKQKLLYDEMVNTPLNELLGMGYLDLAKNQAAYQRLLAELEVEVDANYLQSDQLLTAFSSSFDGLIDFIHSKNIITIPSAVRPTMQETPSFIRATSSASMDTPGPFENNASEAYVNVTLPKANWTEAKIMRFMRNMNNPSIINTAIHEAYPGHYVHFLWMHHINDRVRQILGAKTNSEGWAHYCEQMMLDEGYGGPSNSREAKILRLGQLKKALLRNARFIVGIKMHTENMNMDDAVNFFVKEGYQSKTTAKREVKRGASDPTYLYYTLGKLQILQLRAELKEKQGDAFSLQQFHDDFMRQGRPPINIVRRAMLGAEQITSKSLDGVGLAALHHVLERDVH